MSYLKDYTTDRKSTLKANDELILRLVETKFSHISLMTTIDNAVIVIELGRRTKTTTTIDGRTFHLYGFIAEEQFTIPNYGFYLDGTWSLNRIISHLKTVHGVQLL